MTDFIIVGAGSAGCVLANRLSADPAVRVTLLEAGGPDNHILYRMPAGTLGLMKMGLGNWSYSSTPQKDLDGREMYFPRGKVLGGSSSINGLIFVRGNRADFDRWAQARGGEAWSYENCLPYFKRMEAFAGGPDDHRGGNGPIGVSPAPPPEQMSVIARAVLAAAQQAGYAYNPDINGPDQEGFGRANLNIAGGRRQSTSATYLAVARKRPNLRVITNALASRILVHGNRAIGIEYLQAGRSHTLKTDGEVIIAGGAINSPQLLQLSGIGRASLLTRLGIAVIQDLPGVGENLQDHLVVSLKQEITKPYSALGHLKPLKTAKALAEYVLFRRGPAATTGTEVLAFIKTDPAEAHPNVQFHLAGLLYEDHGRKIIRREGFAITANGTRPRSRGRVMIASADPRQAPHIDPNYLSDPDDLRVLRAAIRAARKIVEQPAFDAFRGPEYEPGIAMQSDLELDSFIRRTALTIYHPVGTCRMGEGSDAVVDGRLRVHGVRGLRIVDASVMPTIVSGNTNAATMMIAERVSDLILEGS